MQLQRAPVPSGAEIKAAEERLHQELEADYAAAKKRKPAGAPDFARKLYERGTKSDDPALRYVQLTEARDFAQTAGDAAGVLNAVEALGRWYEIDVLKELQDGLSKSAAAGRSPAAIRTMGESALTAAYEAMQAGEFTAADKFLTSATGAARRSRDSALTQLLGSVKQELAEAKKDSVAAEKALQTLGQNPDDPDASLIRGSWLCLVRREWPAGLELLARGSDAKLREVVQLDLAKPTGGEAQLAVADAWWQWIESNPKKNRRFRTRAQYWYRQSLADLSGERRKRAETRLY